MKNTDKKFKKMMQTQADFVDREILVQQLMIFYDNDVGDLEKFISSDIRTALEYSTKPEYVWEFCSSIADTADFGFEKNGKYLYIRPNSDNILSFCPKTKKATPLELIEWLDKIIGKK